MKTIYKNARFTCLAPGLVRMEYSPSGTFEDRNSVRIIDRPAGIDFKDSQIENEACTLSTGRVNLLYRGGPFTAESLCAEDALTGETFWTPASVDHANLGGVHVSMDYCKPGMLPEGVHPATVEHHHVGIDQSLWTFHGRLHSEEAVTVGDGANLATLFDEVLGTHEFESLPAALRELMAERWKYPPGILSRAGYFLYNDTPSPRMDPETDWVSNPTAEEGYQDLYLFYYGNDFKQALADYRLLFGATPLMPRYALGLWYSRYPTFNQEEIHQLVDTFEKHDLPLDVFVLDLEWHKRGWYGFDWDTDHIPTPDELLGFLRERGLHTTFNVHPGAVHTEDSKFEQFLAEAGLECDRGTVKPDYRGDLTFDDFDASVPQHAKAFMDVFHKPVQDQGMDFWWIDGDCPVREIPGLERQLWTNHIYYSHIRDNYPDRRPMIFSREPGLGAHRYPFHFTGDTWSYFETLKSQVEQTLRAGHIGQSYITHDIGGHISSGLHIDPELYMRWVQFAVLSPVVRLHSSRISEGVGGERRPWLYGECVQSSFRAAMQFRMTHLPYLYALAKESHATGLPICRSNCIEMPEWEAGYAQWDAYFLGDRIYAAPVVTPGTARQVILPPGKWIHGLTGECIQSDGATVRAEVSPFKEAPLHFIKAGSIVVCQPYAHRASELPDTLEIRLYPRGEAWQDSFVLREDDGMSQDHDHGRESSQCFDMVETDHEIRLTIGPFEGDYADAPATRRYTVRLVGIGYAPATLTTESLPTNEQHEFVIAKTGE
ncbi:MAG: glycoside hydrolase family 31 protein [Planctomycetota bacterium]|jgi:hypothetical protein